MVLNVTSHKLHPFYGNYKFLSPYLDRCTKHLGIELNYVVSAVWHNSCLGEPAKDILLDNHAHVSRRQHVVRI